MIGNTRHPTCIERRRVFGAPLIAFVLGNLALAEPAWTQAQSEEPPLGDLELAKPSFPVHGSLWARVRTRSTPDTNDTDLFTTLRLDFGDLEDYGVEGHIAAIGLADLDGRDNGDFTFFGVYDTYDHRVEGRLHLAYVDLAPPEGLESLRLGRQQLYSTPEFAWFDGVRIESGKRQKHEPVFGAYVGQQVRPFRSSTDGDLMIGCYGEARPWAHARARLDYMRFEDTSVIGSGGNDLLNLKLDQELFEGFDLSGTYSRLDNLDRDLELGVTSYGLGKDLVVRASWFELLEPQGQLASGIDPFSSTMIALEPYRQANVLVTKGVGEAAVVEAGAFVRRVTQKVDVGEFNRDFEHYFLRTTLLDALGTGFDATLSGDSYRATGSNIDTWGLDFDRELTRRLELSFGSYYSLYKYDLFLDAERDDVRTYHVKLRYAWREDLMLDVDYTYEDDELAAQNTIRFGLRWSF